MENFNLKKYLTEGKLINEGKKVTANIWAKLSDDSKIDALLSVFKDPDDAEKYFEKEWDNLPDNKNFMMIYEVYSEKQRRWACSQDGPTFDEMCKDTAISKKKKIKEFVGKELEGRNQVLYDKLVAGSGKSDTKEGEMLRAINRIVYRYYNDGDEYMRGYGTETAGPAHSFLVNANTNVRSAMEQIFGGGTNYEETIEDALEYIVSHIEAKQGRYTPNTEDMFDYEAEFEDEEDYDDYDDYDEDEDY